MKFLASLITSTASFYCNKQWAQPKECLWQEIVFFSVQLGEIEISVRVEPVWGNTPQSVWGRAERINSGQTVWRDLTKGKKKRMRKHKRRVLSIAKDGCKTQGTTEWTRWPLGGPVCSIYDDSGQNLCRRSLFFALFFLLVQIELHGFGFNSMCLCSPVCFQGYSSKIWILILGSRSSLQNAATFIKEKM